MWPALAEVADHLAMRGGPWVPLAGSTSPRWVHQTERGVRGKEDGVICLGRQHPRGCRTMCEVSTGEEEVGDSLGPVTATVPGRLPGRCPGSEAKSELEANT